jgi:hypothetical protein
MSRIKPCTSPGSGMGRQANGKFHAQDYEYVIPQVAHYRPVAPWNMRWSFCGLDQSPGEVPRLVVGEYDLDASSMQPARFLAWDLDAVTGLVVDGVIDDLCSPSAAWLATSPALQGCHVSRSAGVTTVLASTTAGDDLLRATVDGGAPDAFSWPNNPEGLAYFPGSDELWTITETGPRACFAVLRSSL